MKRYSLRSSFAREMLALLAVVAFLTVVGRIVAVTAAAAILAAGTTLTLYRQEKVARVANEVVGELAKVTWPSRTETQVSTIVVVVTSLIAAAIVGVFDAAWSAITDLIYKV